MLALPPSHKAPLMRENPDQNITHRRVLGIAVPIVISNATVPLLGMVDTGVVGQLGEAAPIAAVGIGAIIIGAVYWLFGFLRIGTAGMTAQAVGAGDRAETSALLIRALIIALCGGLLLILLQYPIFSLALRFQGSSPEVQDMARAYMSIRIYAAPFAVAVYGITGWLIAKERTVAVLVVQVWMNGLNMLLDIVFVLQFGWGVEGVAIATIIAEVSGCLLGLWMVRDAFVGDFWKDRSLIFDPVRLRQIASTNSDIIIRSALLEAAFVSFVFFGSNFDEATLAANWILLQFLHLSAHAMDGFAFAAEALVGQAMGAKNRARLRRGAVLTTLWAFVVLAVASLVFWLAGGMIIDLMAKAGDVRAVAREYLPWLIFAPLVGCAAWMLDGIFIGATRTRDMRNMMLISFAVYALSVFILMDRFGNHGLWAALVLFNIVRGITLGLKYPALEAAADR